jgi:hypothetical protein
MIAQWVPQLLGGRYEVRRELGSGGMAVVLEAMDRMLGRRVAVKVLYPHLVGDPAFVERFQREARNAAALSHPNVVAIFDVGSHDGVGSDEIDFIVMEYVEGHTLRQELAAGSLPPDRAAAVAREVCAGLAAAHARGVVHRDIKPANVMLPASGPAKVMDFGLAQAVDAGRLTQSGLVIATAQYASPEQLQGQDADARSDVYSLGCCLYEMLAGAAPFAGGTPVSVAFRQVNEAPVPLRQRNPGLPAGLAAVAARAMEKDPARRYQSAAEMGRALSQLIAGRSTATPPIAAAAGRTGAGAAVAGDATGTAPIAVTGRGDVTWAEGDLRSGEELDGDRAAAEPGSSRRGRRRLVVVGAVVTVCVFAGGLALALLDRTPAAPMVPVTSSSAPVATTRNAPAPSVPAAPRSTGGRSTPPHTTVGQPSTTPPAPTVTTPPPASPTTSSPTPTLSTGTTSSTVSTPTDSPPPSSGETTSPPAAR